MNAAWFGDSYDIVKRFLIAQVRTLGYSVYVDPLPTGEWDAIESAYLRFLEARHVREAVDQDRSLLFLDPDKGIGPKQTKSHIRMSTIVGYTDRHDLVLVYDQSFSRTRPHLPQVLEKLRLLRERGGCGFYYDSHARFLFASRSDETVASVRAALRRAHLPDTRLIELTPSVPGHHL